MGTGDRRMRKSLIARVLARPRRALGHPTDEFRNDLEIQLFGLRRSGNHGVIAWIAQQYERPIVFLNNVRPFQDPFATFMLGGVPNAVPRQRIRPEAVEALRRRRKKLLLVSYEDLWLPRLGRADIIPGGEELVGSSRQVHRVLLLRDFYNWFASRIRLLEIRGDGAEVSMPVVERQVQLWLTYAREFMGETKYLGDQSAGISFNRWFDEENYRASILTQLGIPMRENSPAVVPRTGGGSSFDGTLFSGDAGSMDLLSRWRYLSTERFASYRRLLEAKRDGIDAYNHEIFGLRSPFA